MTLPLHHHKGVQLDLLNHRVSDGQPHVAASTRTPQHVKVNSQTLPVEVHQRERKGQANTSQKIPHCPILWEKVSAVLHIWVHHTNSLANITTNTLSHFMSFHPNGLQQPYSLDTSYVHDHQGQSTVPGPDKQNYSSESMQKIQKSPSKKNKQTTWEKAIY